jgi:hypothetical protein
VANFVSTGAFVKGKLEIEPKQVLTSGRTRNKGIEAFVLALPRVPDLAPPIRPLELAHVLQFAPSPCTPEKQEKQRQPRFLLRFVRLLNTLPN